MSKSTDRVLKDIENRMKQKGTYNKSAKRVIDDLKNRINNKKEG